ncbi:MAG: hypothetical protein KDC92_14710, partial [Bacteroidetes bacterium]|nr:hypothetical protein [Bacteroidota bacterium]
LKHKSPDELVELCLSLAKSKKDAKQLLTYLVFEADDETAYVENVMTFADQEFAQINMSSGYLAKKGIRKVLRELKAQIRYSGIKTTEVEILLHFCHLYKAYECHTYQMPIIDNMYLRTVKRIETVVSSLHSDLQYDYSNKLDELKS